MKTISVACPAIVGEIRCTVFDKRREMYSCLGNSLYCLDRSIVRIWSLSPSFVNQPSEPSASNMMKIVFLQPILVKFDFECFWCTFSQHKSCSKCEDDNWNFTPSWVSRSWVDQHDSVSLQFDFHYLSSTLELN